MVRRSLSVGPGYKGFTRLRLRASDGQARFRSMFRRGFTLIELLIVMAILAILITIALVKFRPFQRISQAYDVQRKSEIRQMQKALLQAMIGGHLPRNIPERKESAKAICQYSYQGLLCTDPPVSGVDLSYLVPDYLASIPNDPIYGSGAMTGYQIYKDGAFFIIETAK